MIYLPDPQYNPEYQTEITSRTKLAPGITIAKFLGGYGDRYTLNHVPNYTDRLKLAKQWYLQAQAMLFVDTDKGDFEDFRMIVVEGFYKQGTYEILADNSINQLMTQGRAVVYELIDSKGNIAVENTFDLAVALKENTKFEKLILDYDTYDPSGELNAQIILIMPDVGNSWDITFDQKLETRYNNFVQGTGELIEVL